MVRATAMRGTIHLMAAPDFLAFRASLQEGLDAGLHAILRDRARTIDFRALNKAALAYFRSPHTFEDVRPLLNNDDGKFLHAPRGCAACHMTGYAGRTGVFEVMSIDKQLRELIGAGGTARAIRACAVEKDMLEFGAASMLKVARGLTCTEEIFRVIPAEHMIETE